MSPRKRLGGRPAEPRSEPPAKRQAPPRSAHAPSSVPKPAPAAVAVKATSPIEGDRLKKYKKVYEILDFDGNATLAVDNARVVLIRQFASSDQRAVQLYLQVQHRNVVEVVEAFSSHNSHYIVMEEMTLCLHHLVRCPTYPSDGQLRSILAQVWFLGSYESLLSLTVVGIERIAFSSRYESRIR